jgi:CDP-diacylglycerol--glycerol-3-phosphate 3-phosphatidyltransferase
LISTYNIKPKFQQLLKPLLEGLYKLKITANQITLSAILLSVIIGVNFWLHPSGMALLLVAFGLLFRMALNALDGMMARTYNMQSKLGEVLNEFGDIVSDLFIYIPLIKLAGAKWYIVIGFIMLSTLNEFAGILAKVIGGERRYDGPMGKSDRALLIGALCLTYYFWGGVYLYVNYIFTFSMLLLLLSTYNRLKNSLK